MRDAGPDLSDWLCLGVGYISLACLAFIVGWMVLSWKVVWQRWRPRLSPHTLLHHLWARLLISAGAILICGSTSLQSSHNACAFVNISPPPPPKRSTQPWVKAAMCQDVMQQVSGSSLTGNMLMSQAFVSGSGQRFSASPMRLWHLPCQHTPLGQFSVSC